ncbi:MAG: ECF-type sigma factor [Phycisphaerales bacterium]
MPEDHGEVTRMIQELKAGDARAADRLLEAVYDELRSLAAVRLRNEKLGQTLSATATVISSESLRFHEARTAGCSH